MKRFKYFKIICILPMLIFVFTACKNENEAGPIIAPLYTETAQPTRSVQNTEPQTLKPSNTAEPTPTAYVYKIEDFLPAQNIYIGYVPLKSDNSFESYVEYMSDSNGTLKIQRRTTSKVGDPPPYVEVLVCSNKELRRNYYKSSVGYTYNVLEKAPNDGEILLKEPIEPGAKWDVESGKSIITSVDTTLRVPMGNVDAVEVTTEYDNGETRRRYFVPGLGMAAEYLFNSSDSLTMSFEAKEHEKDRENKQKIRFFYVDQSGAIKYITREVTIALNQDMAQLFEEKLSIKPSGSSLISFRSSGMDLRSIKVDGSSVRIDLASPLVVEMRYEKICLQALANTFGEYFQCSRVYFTIQGENYESRYMMLLDGEYFSPDVKNSTRY